MFGSKIGKEVRVQLQSVGEEWLVWCVSFSDTRTTENINLLLRKWHITGKFDPKKLSSSFGFVPLSVKNIHAQNRARWCRCGFRKDKRYTSFHKLNFGIDCNTVFLTGAWHWPTKDMDYRNFNANCDDDSLEIEEGELCAAVRDASFYVFFQ